MIHVSAAVAINSEGAVLLASRPENKPPAGWEFPGGKQEPGETPSQALVRELIEELDWQVTPADTIYKLRRPGLTIDFIRVIPLPGSVPVPREGQMCRWVKLDGGVPDGLLANDLEVWEFLSGRVGKFHKKQSC